MLKIPRVSVVMPTFNRAVELPRSIHSVLSQTVRDLELVIIDDASTDSTESVVASFNDDRIRYEKLTKNVGGAEARNVGIRMARSDIVAFQDSDDEWTCLKLESLLNELESDEELGVVFSSYIQVWNTGCRLMPVGKYKFLQDHAYTSLLWQNHIGTPALMVKKKHLDEVGGFDPMMPRYQDWALALNLAQVTALKYVEEPTLLAYVTKGSITQNNNAHRIALERLYEAHSIAISKDKTLKAAWLHRVGDAQLNTGFKNGRRLLFRALLCEPLNLRYLVKFLLALPGRAGIYIIGTKFFGSIF